MIRDQHLKWKMDFPVQTMQRAHTLLNDTFGYPGFRHNQEQIIQTLLDGGDALTLMPTGGGKSLCYQIPALIRPGTGIVVSPLIALMKDQVDALEQLGIRAAYLNSTLDPRSQQETEQALLEGRLDLLYVAPERLLTERMLSLLGRAELALFAIDSPTRCDQFRMIFSKGSPILRSAP